jgi:hypothetical protein
MSLTERDALIIGLLKVIESDNLIFKFNTYVVEILSNKSIKEKDYTLIRKKTFDTAIDKFLDKFPDYWEPNTIWTNSLKPSSNSQAHQTMANPTKTTTGVQKWTKQVMALQ